MKKMKKLFAMLIAMVMVLGMSMSVFAATADGTVTVQGIASDDQVRLYKVLEVDQTSTTGWAVTSQFSSSITTAEALNGITSTEAETLAEAASTVAYSATATGTSLQFAVDPGLYLVIAAPADTNTIYNPAIVSSDYNGENTTNVINLSTAGYSDTTVLKKATIPVDKKVNGADSTDGYSVGDVLPFTITTNMPSYPTNSANATMVITDTPTGLEIDTTTIKVTVAGAEVAEAADTYTLDASKSGITVTFVKSYILAHPANQIVVSYSATLTTVDETTGIASNTAKAKFNQNPNDSSTVEPSDTVEDTTYGIVFKKVDESGTALAGAGFTLYASDGTTVAGTEVISGNDGYVSWSGLKAGTYVIKETTTPAGYVTVADNTVTISATNATNDNPATANVTETNYYTDLTTITNVAGAQLPSTGGIGTTIFYIIGAILVIGAGVVLVTRRRMNVQ